MADSDNYYTEMIIVGGAKQTTSIAHGHVNVDILLMMYYNFNARQIINYYQT